MDQDSKVLLLFWLSKLPTYYSFCFPFYIEDFAFADVKFHQIFNAPFPDFRSIDLQGDVADANNFIVVSIAIAIRHYELKQIVDEANEKKGP